MASGWGEDTCKREVPWVVRACGERRGEGGRVREGCENQVFHNARRLVKQKGDKN